MSVLDATRQFNADVRRLPHDLELVPSHSRCNKAYEDAVVRRGTHFLLEIRNTEAAVVRIACILPWFIERHKLLARTIGINNPFFRTIERREGQSGLVIDGQSQLNFAFCDYLGLSTHPQVMQSSLAAIEEFGTCLSASRMVGGQFPLHRQLEAELAEFCGTEAALLFVSGHAANVSTIGTLMGEKDLVICDEFVHNSAVVGVRLSGATYRTFPHNNYEALDALLAELRPRYENVLIVVEGVYSTEGDLADLPRVGERRTGPALGLRPVLRHCRVPGHHAGRRGQDRRSGDLSEGGRRAGTLRGGRVDR